MSYELLKRIYDNNRKDCVLGVKVNTDIYLNYSKEDDTFTLSYIHTRFSHETHTYKSFKDRGFWHLKTFAVVSQKMIHITYPYTCINSTINKYYKRFFDVSLSSKEITVMGKRNYTITYRGIKLRSATANFSITNGVLKAVDPREFKIDSDSVLVKEFMCRVNIFTKQAELLNALMPNEPPQIVTISNNYIVEYHIVECLNNVTDIERLTTFVSLYRNKPKMFDSLKKYLHNKKHTLGYLYNKCYWITDGILPTKINP